MPNLIISIACQTDDHGNCSGGNTYQPGIMGGWSCRCPCGHKGKKSPKEPKGRLTPPEKPHNKEYFPKNTPLKD